MRLDARNTLKAKITLNNAIARGNYNFVTLFFRNGTLYRLALSVNWYVKRHFKCPSQ